jgi:hypothetical protein
MCSPAIRFFLFVREGGRERGREKGLVRMLCRCAHYGHFFSFTTRTNEQARPVQHAQAGPARACSSSSSSKPPIAVVVLAGSRWSGCGGRA